ncbi:MAG TPA: Omp28-related outer membrane protein [Candidatus Kapabacteria bacterium]|nr:Omp28-related outer membrane protein [Candidatus Kapabacteria bacterium]
MKNLVTLSVLGLGLFGAVELQAQTLPNKILIEEASNASCPPCAQQNPVFEQYLDEMTDNVIGVVYHASWPGATDPMYLNDKTLSTQRITYYGFDNIGVPTCVVNGEFAPQLNQSYQGAPGDIESVDGAVQTALSVASPYTISAERFTQNDSEQVNITVNSNTTVSNVYLRVMVVEGEHYYSNAGTNGEKTFHNIVRKMLPTYKGTKFSLDAGTPKTFSFKYAYNSQWTTDQLSIVAFVQSDVDKAVGAAVRTVDAPKPGFQSEVKTYAGIAPGFEMHVVGTPMGSQKINYTLGGNAPVRVTFSMVDLLGREVQASRTELTTVGEHSFDIHANNLASGMYLVVAKTPDALVQVPVMIGQ